MYMTSSHETWGTITISSGDASRICAAQFFNKLVTRAHEYKCIFHPDNQY